MLTSLDLSHPMALLADRLLIQLPPMAFQDEAIRKQGGLMGFERLCPRDHRAGCDLPGGKLRLVAEESFCLDDGKVAEHVQQRAAQAARDWQTAVPVQEIAPRRHWLLLPESPLLVAQGTARLVGTSYFIHEDRTVLLVHYYLSTDLVASAGEARSRAFVLRVAATLRPGPRGYVRGPAPLSLEGPWGPALSLRLGADYIPTVDRGPDYLVHRLFRLEPLSSVESPSLMVYLGQHPNFHGPARGIPRAETIVPLFGQPASWRAYVEFVDNRPTHRVYETIAPLAGKLACHLRAIITAPAQESSLRAMIASLTVL